METNAYTPAAALSDIDTSNAAIADRLHSPAWYYPVLGLAEAGVIVGIGTPERTAWATALMALSALAMALLPGAYKKHTGLWMGFSQAGPRSRIWWVATVAVVVAGLLVGFLASESVVPPVAAYATAALTFVAVCVMGPLTDRTLRREVREGTAKVAR